MIRTTADGSFVWYRLSSDETMKISVTLEFYLSLAKTCTSEADFRVSFFKKGALTPMTELDQIECNYRTREPLKMVASAAASAGISPVNEIEWRNKVR